MADEHFDRHTMRTGLYNPRCFNVQEVASRREGDLLQPDLAEAIRRIQESDKKREIDYER